MPKRKSSTESIVRGKRQKIGDNNDNKKIKPIEKIDDIFGMMARKKDLQKKIENHMNRKKYEQGIMSRSEQQIDNIIAAYNTDPSEHHNFAYNTLFHERANQSRLIKLIDFDIDQLMEQCDKMSKKIEKLLRGACVF